MVPTPNSEVDVLFSIIEQQRNNAISELARAAARIVVLEAELAKLKEKEVQPE